MNRVDKHGVMCGSFRKELSLTHANNKGFKIMRVRSFINIKEYPFKKGKKKAYICYAGRCGSMGATLTWSHKYLKKGDTDFVMKILDIAMKEQQKVRNVIKRYNRRFN